MLLCLMFPALLMWLAWYVIMVRITPLASRFRRSARTVSDAGILPDAIGLVFGGQGFAEPNSKAREFMMNAYGAGSAFLALAALIFPWVGWGLSPRDDVAERRNRFAGWAVGGAMLGLTLEFLGLGEAVTRTHAFDNLTAIVFFWTMGLVSFFVLWGILERVASFSEAITVERSGGAALRLGALLPALGLLLGRSFTTLAEGTSPFLADGELPKTLCKFLGPFALFFAAVLIERRRRANAPSPGAGPKTVDWLIGLFYLGSAGLLTYLSR